MHGFEVVAESAVDSGFLSLGILGADQKLELITHLVRRDCDQLTVIAGVTVEKITDGVAVDANAHDCVLFNDCRFVYCTVPSLSCKQA
jgi:hypothetical protein